jgi:hypothetical protein
VSANFLALFERFFADRAASTRAALVAFALAHVFSQGVDAADCLKWVKREDVGSYGQRMHHAMAYDSHRGVTVFFGGEIGEEGKQQYFDDTQEYNGTAWVQVPIIGPKPQARSLHAMAYDPDRKQIIMAGGWNGDEHFRDTWIYTNERGLGFWTNVASNVDIYKGNAMVFDSVRRRVITHGGRLDYLDSNDSPSFLWSGITREWDGQSWIEVASTPNGVYKFGLAFDGSRGIAMAAAGGLGPFGAGAPIFEYRPGQGWTEHALGLLGRDEVALAYDERRQRIVMVGGNGVSPEVGEEVYEFLPAERSWITLPRLPSGQGRAGAKIVYDSRRGVMVLTGGAGGGAENADEGGRYSDTWELGPSLSISQQPASTTNQVCGVTPSSFFVEAQGVGPFQYQWRLDGEPLVDDAHFSGSQRPLFSVIGVRYEHAGNYDVIIKDSCGAQNVITSQVATLTIQPGAEWVFRGNSGPSARFHHSMVYDSGRGVTVLFGGQTNWNGIFPSNDLWEWDGARWTLRVENSVTNGWTFLPQRGWVPNYTVQPVRRARFAMAYDSLRGRTVIFGGMSLSPDQSQVTLKDLWEWDGTRWYFRSTNGPIARFDPSMTYDERRGRAVLFGGTITPGLGEQSDGQFVWEWDGEAWNKTELSEATENPCCLFNQGNNFADMIYDSYRGVVVFGPTEPLSIAWSGWEFWEWDGATWTRNNTVLDTLLGTNLGSLAFDRQLRRSVFFGGLNSSPQNDGGYYDGTRWTHLTNSPPVPDARLAAAMAYDARRNVTVLFGGSLAYGGETPATNDTWELAAVDTPLINEHPASQYRRAGQTATFTVKAVGPGSLSYQWYRGDVRLAEGVETLTIPAVRAQDAGVYKALVSSGCGQTWSRSAILTLDPKLQIFSADNSTTLVWERDPKVVLEVADSVSGPWTIVPNPPIPFNISARGPGKYFRLRRLN